MTSEFAPGTRVRRTMVHEGVVRDCGLVAVTDTGALFGLDVEAIGPIPASFEVEALAPATCDKTEGMTGLDCGREPGHPGRCFVGISYDPSEPYGWEARQAPEPAAVLPVEDNQQPDVVLNCTGCGLEARLPHVSPDRVSILPMTGWTVGAGRGPLCPTCGDKDDQ